MTNSNSIKTLLNSAVQQLNTSSSARLDAEILLSHVLAKPRSFLYACPEYEPSGPQQQQFAVLLQRRASGEPVAYLTGKKEFWSLPLRVSSDTLIPRPETELLVSTALELGAAIPASPVCAIDLGTGTGCIALALAHERPSWKITAVDSSLPALKIAQANADSLRIKSIRWHNSNWFGNLTADSFDLILANPPYIAANDPHLRNGDVRFEPRQALVGGDSGLEAIIAIATQSRAHMRGHSRLLLEIGHDQAAAVHGLLEDLGYTGIEFRQDLHGINRVCIASLIDR